MNETEQLQAQVMELKNKVINSFRETLEDYKKLIELKAEMKWGY